MILRQGLVPIAAGLVIGGLVALGLTRLMESMLYGVSSTDPATYAGVSLLLASVALVASLLPALRAARSGPLVTLRHE